VRTSGSLLMEYFERTVRSGEVPYQANRRAARAIDIFRDDDEGLGEILVMLDGIDVFISDLEGLLNAANRVEEQARASLR
jgi:hypothetical protein